MKAGITTKRSVRVGLCGDFQVGKSLLLNVLFGRTLAVEGDGMATTRFPVVYQYGKRESVSLIGNTRAVGRKFERLKEFWRFIGTEEGQSLVPDITEAQVELPRTELLEVSIADMPGLDADNADNEKAKNIARTLDFALLVTRNQGLGQRDKQWLEIIDKLAVPAAYVINCFHNNGKSPVPSANKDIVQNNAAWLNSQGFRHVAIGIKGPFVVNVAWCASCERSLDEGPNAEERNNAVGSHFKDKVPSPEELRMLSQVGVLRRFLLPEPENHLGWNAPGFARLHQATAAWVEELKGVIDKSRNLLNDHR